jgi:hypothetical protein
MEINFLLILWRTLKESNWTLFLVEGKKRLCYYNDSKIIRTRHTRYLGGRMKNLKGDVLLIGSDWTVLQEAFCELASQVGSVQLTDSLEVAEFLCGIYDFDVVMYGVIRSADGSYDTGDFFGKLREGGYRSNLILMDNFGEYPSDDFYHKRFKRFWDISLPSGPGLHLFAKAYGA